MAKLKHEHLLFATEYINNGGNATAAYQVAYVQTDKDSAGAAAARLMKRPDIMEYIEEAQEAIKNKALWSMEEMILQLKTIAQTSTRESIVIDAISTAAKIMNIGNKQEVKHTGSIDKTINITSLSDAELLALAGEEDE